MNKIIAVAVIAATTLFPSRHAQAGSKELINGIRTSLHCAQVNHQLSNKAIAERWDKKAIELCIRAGLTHNDMVVMNEGVAATTTKGVVLVYQTLIKITYSKDLYEALTN